MPKMKFTSDGTVNGKQYKKGDEVQVSPSIAEDLQSVQKCAEVVKSSPKKKSE